MFLISFFQTELKFICLHSAKFIKLKGGVMRKNLLLASIVITLVSGNLNASEGNDSTLAKKALTDHNIQDMKRQHRAMTQGALSELGMEARRKLILSKKDEVFHGMIKSGDIVLSKTDNFSAGQINH
jgi:hypothetical protein